MKENYKGLPWYTRKVIVHNYPLSQQERLELAEEMSNAHAELVRLKNSLAALKESYKEQIDMVTGQFSQAAKKYKEGVGEPVEIECDCYQDLDNDEMVFVPIDSDNELLRKPLTEKEKMPNLFAPPNRGKIIDFPNQGEA